MDEPDKHNIMLAYDFYGIEVIGRDVGGWRKAACPLPDHEDANPSASVNEEACRWRCHTCDRGGDIYDLIQEREPDCVGLTAAKRRADELFGDGDSPVRGERGGSSLLPRKSGNKPRGGLRVPPWRRL